MDILEIAGDIEGVMQGSITDFASLMMNISNSIKNVSDALFYRTLKQFMEGIEEKETYKRKIGKKLAESAYSTEYGFVLLKYIDSFETAEKGKYLSYLLDSLSKDLISVEQCFCYADIIRNVSLSGLRFIKNNISNKVFSKYNIVFEELNRYDLLYDANEGGKAFELKAYYIDKFSLSYCDEKYKYNGEDDYIPQRSDFPRKTIALAISQGAPY